MARVPVRDYQVGVPGGRVGTLVNISDAGIAGQSIARGISRTSGDIADYAIRHETLDTSLGQREQSIQLHLSQLEQRQKIADLQASATLDVQEAAQNALNAPDPSQSEQMYRGSVEGLRKKWREAAGGDEGLAQELDGRMALVSRGKMLDVRQGAIRLRAQTAVGRLDNTLDQLSRASGLASSDRERASVSGQAFAAIDAAVAGGAIRADQGDAQKQKFIAGVDDLTARRLIQENPDNAVKALTAGRFGSLDADRRQQLVEFATRSSEADARQREADIAKNVAAEKAATATANAWGAVDLKNGLIDGSKGLKDIEAARAEGKLTPGAAEELYGVFERTQRVHQEKAIDTERVALAMAGQGVLDPKSSADRKAVDAFWVNEARDVEPKKQLDLAVTIATRTGILPPALAGQLNGAMRSTPENRAWGAKLIAQVEQASPGAVEDIPTETRRIARLTTDYMSGGFSPEDAATRVDEQMKAPDPVRKIREKEMTAGGLNSPIERAWTSAISSRGKSAFREGQSIFNSDEQGLDDPETVLPLKADYERYYRDAYVATGDDAAARAEAVGEIRKRWGVTDADGNRRWMRYPPEKVYGAGEWIGEQLVRDVTPLVSDSTDLGERVSIRSDELTARAMSAGQDPGYGVIVREPSGRLGVVLAEDGSPFRFYPQRAAAAASDRESAIGTARAEHEKFIRGLGPTTTEAPDAGSPESMGLPGAGSRYETERGGDGKATTIKPVGPAPAVRYRIERDAEGRATGITPFEMIERPE